MRVFTQAVLCFSLFSSTAWAVTETEQAPVASVTANTTAPTNTVTANASPTTKPLTAEQIAKQKATAEANVKALVKDQATRLEQLEKANLEALS
nr:hypothetical protein [Acinetobacter sp.]